MCIVVPRNVPGTVIAERAFLKRINRIPLYRNLTDAQNFRDEFFTRGVFSVFTACFTRNTFMIKSSAHIVRTARKRTERLFPAKLDPTGLNVSDLIHEVQP